MLWPVRQSDLPSYLETDFSLGVFPANRDLRLQSDADALSFCTSVAGSVLVSPLAAGNICIAVFFTIGGDLIIENASELISFGSPDLREIEGRLSVTNCSKLSLLRLTVLNTGSLDLSDLPSLRTNNFTTPLNTTSVTISNTGLSALPEVFPSVVDYRISNNNKRINSASPLIGINGTLDIVYDGFTQQDIGGTLRLIGSDHFQTLSLPLLSAVGGSIILNGSISTLDVPVLSIVHGNVSITTDNSAFKCLSAEMDKLFQVVKGQVSCQGNIINQVGSPNPSDPLRRSTKSGVPKNAKIGLVVGVALVVICIGAAVVFAWKKVLNFGCSFLSQKPEIPHPKIPELPRGNHHEKTELCAVTKPNELATSLWGPVLESYELHGGQRQNVNDTFEAQKPQGVAELEENKDETVHVKIVDSPERHVVLLRGNIVDV
ncbi:uncharacterized protein PAC_09442 [Phialocephala subalpina]|uniref:Receptor L-domain domain-containing protein n=1 Tax=Phialocephala subalpina TaxID=576137 RepID=A0A1L7X3F1_9HELO|nr:uncharacterized protein PAC_09442 [Phialocephala subalpina]